MSEGITFNIQRYSIQDGPGIRSTVFLKGCPLRCSWCSNPESQNSFPEVAYRNVLCNKCGRCLEVCEVQAISLTEDGIKIDRTKCDNCGKCVDACYLGAITVYGKRVSVEDVYEEIKKDDHYYRMSGGGVTASGGEPLGQPEFVTELFKYCRQSGVHTTLDTTGFASPQSLTEVLQYTDLVLYDLKHMDTKIHQKVTGVPNEMILDNLQLITAKGTPVIIRVPVIPGVNDSEDDIRAIASFVARLNHANKVELLAYHRFGIGKYGMLDRQYELGDMSTPTEEKMQSLIALIKSFGLDCECVG